MIPHPTTGAMSICYTFTQSFLTAKPI